MRDDARAYAVSRKSDVRMKDVQKKKRARMRKVW